LARQILAKAVTTRSASSPARLGAVIAAQTSNAIALRRKIIVVPRPHAYPAHFHTRRRSGGKRLGEMLMKKR
jgi:hypothetical protein